MAVFIIVLLSSIHSAPGTQYVLIKYFWMISHLSVRSSSFIENQFWDYHLSLSFLLPVSPQHFWRWLIQPWPHLKAAFQITWLTQNPHVVIPRLFPNLVQMYFFQNSDFKNLFLGYSVLIFQLTLVLVQ